MNKGSPDLPICYTDHSYIRLDLDLRTYLRTYTSHAYILHYGDNGLHNSGIR